MMNRIFGFLSCAWAGTTALKSAAVAISSDKPLRIKFRFILFAVVVWFCLGGGIIESNGDYEI
jgi:hypothetical protein